VKAPDWLVAEGVLGNVGPDHQKAPLAYRRFVRQGIKASSPWDSLRGQMWLGGDAFRGRMVQRVADQNLNAVPKAQTCPDWPHRKRCLMLWRRRSVSSASRCSAARTRRLFLACGVASALRVSLVLEGGLGDGRRLPLTDLEDSGPYRAHRTVGPDSDTPRKVQSQALTWQSCFWSVPDGSGQARQEDPEIRREGSDLARSLGRGNLARRHCVGARQDRSESGARPGSNRRQAGRRLNAGHSAEKVLCRDSNALSFVAGFFSLTSSGCITILAPGARAGTKAVLRTNA
jgi:hypothetical protein